MGLRKWSHIVADCETDDLVDKLTKLHCLVLRDLESGDILSCADQEDYLPIKCGLAALEQAERVYWHNGIHFDFPAIKKVYGKEPHDRSRMFDTFIVACMRWAHIKDRDYASAKLGKFPARYAGLHTLEAWGYRLGIRKGDYKDWCKANGIEKPFETWRPEMQAYCEQDTNTTRTLALTIIKAGTSPESVEIEHGLAWYLTAQEFNGIPFDVEKATSLQGTLAERRHAVEQELIAIFGTWTRNKGLFTPKRDNKKKGYVKGVPVMKTEEITFNPSSRAHIADRLTKLYNWIPTEFTPSGQPEVNERTLASLKDSIPAVKLLDEYLLLDKRLGQVAEGKQAWLKQFTNDSPAAKMTGLSHIHHRVKQNFAITHRAAHANPNLGQVPKVGSPYGAECRELFYVPDGWVMIGADASSLEARCLAHYMARYDDGAYGKLLLEGDVHTANRIALELPGDTELVAKVARSGAKNWFYGFIYGSGDLKAGKMLAFLTMPDGTFLMVAPPGGWGDVTLKALGKKKKNQFLKNTPALGRLIEDVKAAAKKRGFLVLVDGRRGYIRSDHSALNTLLQAAGAIIVKRWIVNAVARLEREFGPQGWDGLWAGLLYVHDEIELAVRPHIVEPVKAILMEELEKLTGHFKWRVPLAGEAKVGRTWKDVH